MRHLLIAASATALLLASGAAFAQSGQGGAIGKDPTAGAPVAPPADRAGSGQGGYLGSKPGDAAGTMNNSGGAGAAGNTGSGQGGYLGTNPGGSTTTDPATDPNRPRRPVR